MLWPLVVMFAVLAGVVVGLIRTRISPDMVLLGGLAVLVVAGVIAPEEALEGFGNVALMTIGALFVVAEGLRHTGALSFLSMRLLGEPKSLIGAQLRMMTPIAALSAFMNNTPVVAMMMPVVDDWARRRRMSISKLLLPLSYASIFGGLITLVGTSTTLVVNGLLLETPGERGLSMFEIGWIGVPLTILGLLYIPLTSKWLLPERRPAMRKLEDPREYTVEMMVSPASPIVGKSIEAAGLRNLQGMYLMEILRNDHVLGAVSPETRIESGDRLVFVGIVESVVDLQRIPGLTPATDQLFKIDEPRSHRCLVEAVVSSSFRFNGMTIREAKFRTHYNAVVIAVARDGERLHKKIGDIVLRPGDTLLLETNPSFADVQRNSRDFFLVSRVKNSTPPSHERAWAARLILIGMVVLVAIEAMSMVKAASLAAILMVVMRCIRVSQAKRSIDWGVLVGIGAGLGIGRAMEVSRAAELIAGNLLDVLGASPHTALAALFALTMVLANLITTKAAAVLVYPIALSAAHALGVSFMPFAISIIVAAASSYVTPIGYQTNLMVNGPGGYQSIDWLRIGAPLSVLTFIVTMVVAPLAWPF